MATINLGIQTPPRLRGIPSPEDAALAIAREQLLVLGLMTSRRCNLRCDYCYTDGGTERLGELGIADRIRVLREAADLGSRLLWIPGEGEPLMDRTFWGMLEEAENLGLWTLLYTSGALVNAALAKRLATFRCSVVVKLNSLRQDVQDRLAGVPGTTDRIQRGIDFLLQAGLGDGRLGGETVIVPENAEEIPAIFRFCRNSGIVPYIERLLPAGRGESDALQLAAIQEDRIFADLAGIDREEFGFDWDPVGTFAAGLWSCDRILHTLVVDATGLVHPCVAIHDAFGDVREHSLASIWTGPKLTAFRRSLAPLTGKGVCFCRESLKRRSNRSGIA